MSYDPYKMYGEKIWEFEDEHGNFVTIYKHEKGKRKTYRLFWNDRPLFSVSNISYKSDKDAIRELYLAIIGLIKASPIWELRLREAMEKLKKDYDVKIPFSEALKKYELAVEYLNYGFLWELENAEIEWGVFIGTGSGVSRLHQYMKKGWPFLIVSAAVHDINRLEKSEQMYGNISDKQKERIQHLKNLLKKGATHEEIEVLWNVINKDKGRRLLQFLEENYGIKSGIPLIGKWKENGKVVTEYSYLIPIPPSNKMYKALKSIRVENGKFVSDNEENLNTFFDLVSKFGHETWINQDAIIVYFGEADNPKVYLMTTENPSKIIDIFTEWRVKPNLEDIYSIKSGLKNKEFSFMSFTDYEKAKEKEHYLYIGEYLTRLGVNASKYIEKVEKDIGEHLAIRIAQGELKLKPYKVMFTVDKNSEGKAVLMTEGAVPEDAEQILKQHGFEKNGDKWVLFLNDIDTVLEVVKQMRKEGLK